MKRVALCGVFIFITAAAFAGDTQRYLVATRGAARVTALGSLAQELRDPARREVTTFRLVDGFAANLTSSEVAELRRSPHVRWVEPVVPREFFASPVSTPGQQVVPYGIAQVAAPAAWVARRSGDVNVAVIDSGIDHRHPDLAAAFAGGVNVVKQSDDSLDKFGHGTHVAGTIAAADNAFGVVGVAPHVRLWAVKIAKDDHTLTNEDIIKAMEWVVAKKKELGGRWVVNLSLGGDVDVPLEREAFAKGVAAGLVIVAATGNGSTSATPRAVSYPAAYPGVLAVGAVDEQQKLATFSNQGPEVAFAAPGMRVVSTILTGTGMISYVRARNTAMDARPLTGSKLGGISGEYVYCGLGEPQDFPADMQGKIALIRRGGGTFATRTRNAMRAGAAAVVIFNKDESAYQFTLIDTADPTTRTEVWPIAVAMSKADGETLAAAGRGAMAIEYAAHDYGSKNGTSMATPHVTGAVALLWSLAPEATPQSLVAALAATARDLGAPGRDPQYGHGAIDVFAAAKMLAPEAFNPVGRKRRASGS